MTLAQLKKDSVAKIVKIRSTGSYGEKLMEMGFVPGTVVMIDDEGIMGQPMQLTIRGYRVSLRKKDAVHIEVQT